MKKSLFAIAAATAFTGAAHAQSSVTVYGILDVGYISQTERVAGNIGTTGPASAGAYGATTTTTSGFASSGQSTSRIGFRGTEDLGGGMNAFFTFETALNPAGSNTLSAFNNRQAFIGLGQKGLGNVRIGTQYTPVHEAVGATDAGQQNNVPGNLIYGLDQSVNGQNTGTAAGQYPGANSPQYYNSTGALFQGGPGGGANTYTIRSNNMIRFASENMSGFTGKLFYVQGNSNTNQTSTVTSGNTTNGGGSTNSTGWGVGLDYTWKKLLVTANYQNFKQQTSATVVQNSTGDITTAGFMVMPGTSNTGGVNSNDNQMYFGATYDFGILKAYAQYIDRKVSATYNNNVYVKRTAQQLGVRGNVTKTVEAFASIGTGKLTNSDAVGSIGNSLVFQSTAANLSGWQLGSNYWLSKRTNLYAIYGIQQTGNAVYPTTTNGSTAGNNAVSNNISAYALGIRHTF